MIGFSTEICCRNARFLFDDDPDFRKNESRFFDEEVDFDPLGLFFPSSKAVFSDGVLSFDFSLGFEARRDDKALARDRLIKSCIFFLELFFFAESVELITFGLSGSTGVSIRGGGSTC